MIRGILFDLDGTLISLRADGSVFRNAASAELRRLGFDVDSIDHISGRNYVQDILDAAKLQIERGLVRADYPTVRERTYRALDALELGWIGGSHPLPGTKETLSNLRASRGSSLKLAVLTNSGRPATTYAMERFGFARYMDATFTRDDLPVLKPRPEGVLAALNALSLEPDEAIFVGDSRVDILACKAAGVRIVSVPTGGQDLETLRRDGPDHAVPSFLELEELLSGLG